MKLLLLLLLTTATCLSQTGCASWFKPKTSTRIYAGDGPTIIYTNPESAGGPLGGKP